MARSRARSNGSTLLHSKKCTSQTRVKRQKGRVTEQRMANVQMSRTVEVVKVCHPHFTQSRYNCKTPDLFWREYSLSRIFTDLILHNYRSNQSAFMTRFGTDLRHQYGIFGGKSQTSFTRNATRAGSEEGRLFSQAMYISTYLKKNTTQKIHIKIYTKLNLGPKWHVFPASTIDVISCFFMVVCANNKFV